MDTVRLYFPSMDQDNQPINQAVSNPIYKQIIKDISELSGGCTVYPVQGFYLSSTGKLIEDDISLITVYTDKLQQMTELIKNESMIILKSLNQESVLIEINNRIEFITIDK